MLFTIFLPNNEKELFWNNVCSTPFIDIHHRIKCHWTYYNGYDIRAYNVLSRSALNLQSNLPVVLRLKRRLFNQIEIAAKSNTDNSKLLEIEDSFAYHPKIMEINKNDLSSQPKDTESLLPICKVIRYTGYIVCLSLFGLSSFAIFRAYTSKTTIKSTKVEPSPYDLLDSPTILVCNSSAYKVQTLPTTMASYRNNTMNKKDVLLEAYHVTDTTKGLLDYKPSTIKDDFKEIATIFHGNCIIYEKQLKVIDTE